MLGIGFPQTLDLVKDFLPAYSKYLVFSLHQLCSNVLSCVAASERQTRVAGKLTRHVAVLVTYMMTFTHTERRH